DFIGPPPLVRPDAYDCGGLSYCGPLTVSPPGRGIGNGYPSFEPGVRFLVPKRVLAISKVATVGGTVVSASGSGSKSAFLADGLGNFLCATSLSIGSLFAGTFVRISVIVGLVVVGVSWWFKWGLVLFGCGIWLGFLCRVRWRKGKNWVCENFIEDEIGSSRSGQCVEMELKDMCAGNRSGRRPIIDKDLEAVVVKVVHLVFYRSIVFSDNSLPPEVTLPKRQISPVNFYCQNIWAYPGISASIPIYPKNKIEEGMVGPQPIEEEFRGGVTRDVGTKTHGGPTEPVLQTHKTPSPSSTFIKENIDVLRTMIKEHDQQDKMKATPRKLAYVDSDKEAPAGSLARGFSDRFSLESSGTSDTHKQNRSASKSRRTPSKNKEPTHLRRSRRLEDQSITKEKSRMERSKPKGKRSGHQETSSNSEHEEGSEDTYEDRNSPYKRPKPTLFTQRITRFKYRKRAKLPQNIRVYEGS
ncbi:hypothetical protein Tco_1010884, partial [Tanacetum coccineum]